MSSGVGRRRRDEELKADVSGKPDSEGGIQLKACMMVVDWEALWY
jgi:hypothetical protein